MTLITGTFVIGNTALASTPAGTFELEGNATSANEPAATKPDDWDRVCHQVTGTDCSTANNTNGAGAVAWAPDTHGIIGSGATAIPACSGTNCTIFTGGGSKDPIDIDQWAWKDNTGGLPDKDNLLHGFAARYSLPPSASCVIPVGSPAGTKCEMLFFGNDRFDNSGDAQQGFWFFQNKIGLGSNAVGGGDGFTTSGGTEFHRAGDLLLISDFSNGGSVSTITVYTWDTGCKSAGKPPFVSGVSCGDTNLRFQASSDSANCGLPDNVDPAVTGFCGIVNGANGTVSPWPFVDKTAVSASHPANTFLQGEFYEGGVNLSFLGLGGECFASIASETRASTTTNAVLKDFVLGNFGDCTSHITTTPQTGAGAAMTDHSSPANGVVDVSIGGGSVAVRDHAAVSVSGVSTWAGSVAFSLCKLPLTPTTSNCATGGVAIPYVAPATGNVSNVTPAVDSPVTTLTSVGRYCWRATFTATTPNVPNATDPAADSTSTTECFEVLPVQPTLTTQASGPAIVNTPISDTATISGLATQPGTNGIVGSTSINATNGAAAGGSITWRALGPGDCTTVAMAATSRAVSGNGTYPKTAAPDSQPTVGFSPSATGTYTFVAAYTAGDVNNLGIAESACPDTTGTETVIVGSSSITTTPQAGNGGTLTDHSSPLNGVIDVSIGSGSVTVRDHAVVGVTGITPWSGVVAFSLCGPLPTSPTTSNCEAGGVSIPFPVPATDGAVSNTSPNVDSPITTLTSAGRYCWRATFTSGTTGVPNSTDPKVGSGTTTECFEVLPVQPTLTTQASGTVTVNTPISDTAMISGLATQPGTNGIVGSPSINATNGAPAGGSITWRALGPNNCTTVAMTATSRAVSGNGTYPKTAAPDNQATVGFTPTALGTYTFVAAYGGNSPNNLTIPESACPDTSGTETVVVTGTSSLATSQDWLPNDTATLTGDSNLNGTLTFQLYSGDNCGATSGSAISGQLYTVTVTNKVSGSAFSTTNTTHKVTAPPGTSSWSWLVSYNDSTLADPPNSCEKTTLTITN